MKSERKMFGCLILKVTSLQFFETAINIYQSTWLNNQKDLNRGLEYCLLNITRKTVGRVCNDEAIRSYKRKK